MNKPAISPNFTLEDIRKIREYNHERRKDMTYEEYWSDVSKGANKALEIMAKLKREKSAI